MNWEAISTIAEIVGATAVVVSLVYLAAQIRQNNRQVEEQVRALRLQAYDSAGADFSALRLHISGSLQLSSVWRRAKDSYCTLEPEERAQANELFHENMWAYQNIFSSGTPSATPPSLVLESRCCNDRLKSQPKGDIADEGSFVRDYLSLPPLIRVLRFKLSYV
jgi:hypothetical protein